MSQRGEWLQKAEIIKIMALQVTRESEKKLKPGESGMQDIIWFACSSQIHY